MQNILDLAAAHPQKLNIGAYNEVLSEIEREIKDCFQQAPRILRSHDAEQARQVMLTYRAQVSDTCDQIVEDVVTGKLDDKSASEAATLALYARYLKRISAHLKNVLSSVVNPFHRIGYKEKRKNNAT